jgi:hypothetical protein
MINLENYQRILAELKPFNAELVAVSKTKPVMDILELKEQGQKIFGENYTQELVIKSEYITDVDWHFIGHLQSNKVKSILPLVKLIHGIDSLKLLQEVQKQSERLNLITNCLLQIFIADEKTKFGFSFKEAEELLKSDELSRMKNISIKGFMGMATNTEDETKIRSEFKQLKTFQMNYPDLKILSMGMSGDYKIALEEGATMIRIGSAIFGERNYASEA